MTAKLASVAPHRGETSTPDAAAIIAALPDAVLLLDKDNAIHFANPAAEQLFDTGAAALCACRLEDLVQFDSRLVALVDKVRGGLATVAEYDIDLRSPHIRARPVDAQVAVLADASDWLMISLRERSIAEKLDRQLTHLGVGRSVASLAAVLAHEVKNPLSGIRGAAQLIEQRAAPEDRELTGLIIDETDRICRLVDRMEIFSDKRLAEYRAVNIHEVLDHVRRLALSGFARNVSFVERYDPSLPPVFGNRDELVQVMLNLVKNAARAVPDNGGEITLGTSFEPGMRLTAGGRDRGSLRLPLMVSIQDNGAGVPDELRNHLFDPFVSGQTGGSGLGLSLVAKIVGDHGGVIEFESAPRRTVFRVLLPLHHSDGHQSDGATP